MRTITKYQAEDGTEFTDEKKCQNHEALCAEVANLMAQLPPLPQDDGLAFMNGKGYIQHEPSAFWEVRDSLLKIAQRFSDFHWLQQSLDDRAVHSSYPARIIGDSCPSCVVNAFHRICCTDRETLREYGQPYYVTNPDKIEGGRINP